MKKLKKQNIRLFSVSLVTSVFVFSGVALAAQPTYTVGTEQKGCPAGYSVQRAYGDGLIECKLIAPPKKPATPRQVKSSKTKRAEQNNNNQADATPVAAPSANPPVETVTTQVAAPQLAPDPEGDIYVTTYLDIPGATTVNNHDHRIGSIPITIQRNGGNEGCSTHSTNKGKTFGLENRKGSDGKLHLVKGTIQFANCNASDGSHYTVTATPRKGYVMESDATKSFDLVNGQTKRVSFVLKKKVVAKSTVGAKKQVAQ